MTTRNIMNINVTKIGEYIALTKDKNLTPKARKNGDIVLEKQIGELDEVKELQTGCRVWDVGAFIGDTAILFADFGCFVHAFEAQTDAYFCLEYNSFKYNSVRNKGFIKPYHCIVGDGRNCLVNENPLNGNLGTRSVSITEDGIKSLCLDDMQKENLLGKPALVKIDIEGSEPMAIIGMMDALKTHHPKVLVEIYHPMLERNGFKSDDVYKLLTNDAGYNKWRTAIGSDSDERFDLMFWKE